MATGCPARTATASAPPATKLFHRRIESNQHCIGPPGTGCLLSVDAVSPHDGAGAGLEPSRLCNVDRDGFRISTLDQRAGRATPAASIGGNATQSLRDAIARIREQLGIRPWPIAALPLGPHQPKNLIEKREHNAEFRSDLAACRQSPARIRGARRSDLGDSRDRLYRVSVGCRAYPDAEGARLPGEGKALRPPAVCLGCVR